MRLFYHTTFVLLVFILTLSGQNGDGDNENFELGSAMYRGGAAGHGHAGVFMYFSISTDKIAHIQLSEQQGSSAPGANLHVLRLSTPDTLDPTSDTPFTQLATLKSTFKSQFCDGHSYYGIYSIPSYVSAKERIAADANTLGSNTDIGYTWMDMIDAKNHWQWWPPGWYEDWDGSISDIDEIRCDGVVEYCYDKNGLPLSNNNNIAAAGNSHLNAHNDFHNGDYNEGELCPKIQAGRGHGGSNSNDASTMVPLTAEAPTISNFAVDGFNTLHPVITFTIDDNESVKAYVLAQVKQTTSQDWEVLHDSFGCFAFPWNFREVNLTETTDGTDPHSWTKPLRGRQASGKPFWHN